MATDCIVKAQTRSLLKEKVQGSNHWPLGQAGQVADLEVVRVREVAWHPAGPFGITVMPL